MSLFNRTKYERWQDLDLDAAGKHNLLRDMADIPRPTHDASTWYKGEIRMLYEAFDMQYPAHWNKDRLIWYLVKTLGETDGKPRRTWRDATSNNAARDWSYLTSGEVEDLAEALHEYQDSISAVNSWHELPE